MMCAFLCSVHAGYMTGQNLLMDGGQYPGTYYRNSFLGIAGCCDGEDARVAGRGRHGPRRCLIAHDITALRATSPA